MSQSSAPDAQITEMCDKSRRSRRTEDNCIKIEGRDRQSEDIMSSLVSSARYGETKSLIFPPRLVFFMFS